MVGSLRGSAGYNGRSSETNLGEVDVYLRNLAAQRGADTLVNTGRWIGAKWDVDSMSQPRGSASSGGCPNCVTMTADAYRCAAAPRAVAAPARAPAPAPTAAAPAPAAPRDSDLEAALGAAMVRARTCRRPEDPAGDAPVEVSFGPSGEVVYVEVSGGPFVGSPVGDCVARKFRNAHVPPFEGPARQVHVNLRLGE